MIVLVTGGRDYRDRPAIFHILDQLHARHGFSLLVHGAARGLDRIAHAWALSRGVQPVAMEALWEAEGDRAGLRRNARMYAFARPRLVIAFPGGRGTANMMRIAYDGQRAGDPVEVFDTETDFAASPPRFGSSTG